MKYAGIALALAASMALAACGGEDTAAVEAAPEGTIDGVTISNARMVLAPVEGNPAAVYFDFSYDGDRAFALSGASVEGAESAVMHQFGEYDFKVQMMETMAIPVNKGTKLEFKPGDLHVMAEGVSADLKPGGKTKVTLKISGGKTHEFEAEILAAGDER